MSESETTQYFNDMLAQLEALLYHEVALSAVKKVDFVGTDYLNTKEIQGDTAEEIVESCIKELTTKGIVKEAKHSLHGFDILLKLEIKGCIQIPKEAKLKREGIEPYMGPIANMIGDRIIEIVLHCFLGDRKAHRDSLVGVASREAFLCSVVRDRGSLGLHRSCSKASQLHFLFKRSVRRFSFVNCLMLVIVFCVLQPKKGVQPRKEFFHHLRS